MKKNHNQIYLPEERIITYSTDLLQRPFHPSLTESTGFPTVDNPGVNRECRLDVGETRRKTR